MRLLASLILVLWSGAAARGQHGTDSTYTHEVVTITATRAAVTAARAPVRIAVLDSFLLSRTPEASAASLLQSHAGLFVRRYGPGGLATVSLRGSTPSQTVILLDGQRISDPQLGQVDLNLLPVHMLGSIEIMHGPASALYGSDGMGGVVNLRSAPPAADPLQVRLSSFAGAFGERGGNATFSTRHGDLGATAAIQYRAYDGDFPYEDQGYVPVRTVRREGADVRQWSAFSALDYRLRAARVAISALYTDSERGVAGTSGSVSPDERQWDTSFRLWSRVDHPFRNGTLTARALFQRSELRYVNPRLALDQTGSTLTTSTEIEIRQAVGRSVLAGLGLNLGTGSARHPHLAASPSEYQAAVFGHASLHAGGLALYPSVRADYFRSDNGDEWLTTNPRLGANLRLGVLPLHLKASAGRSFRTPTFNDRFWQPGGNPELKPERGSSVDAGLHLDVGPVRLETSVFHSQISDQIVWLPRLAGYWSPENLSRVLSRGTELSASFSGTAAPGLSLSAAAMYNFTRAIDRSDPDSRTFGQPLRYVPAHVAKSHVGATYGWLEGTISTRFTGRRFVTADGSESLDAFVEMGATASVTPTLAGRSIRFSIEVENLLDRRYEIIQGHPMPGRHGRFRVAFVYH